MGFVLQIFQDLKTSIDTLGSFLAEFIYAPVLSLLYQTLTSWERQGVFFVLLSFLTAYFLWRFGVGVGRDERVFAAYFKFDKIYKHPSAVLDYLVFFVFRPIVNHVIGVVMAGVILSTFVFSWMFADVYASVFGAIAVHPKPGLGALALYGLAVALFMDFAHYWVHRVFHVFPILWEFHKFHHSAEVLQPFTAGRVHPVEDVLETVFTGLVIGAISGVMVYLYGEEVNPLTLGGINYVSLFFNMLASNLRHSQYWLSFGPAEYVFCSPAQHQIHHSTNPRHYNKNYSTNFSLWDWLFGTLYVTSREKEEIAYGLGPKEDAKYRTLKGLYLHPFAAAWKIGKKNVLSWVRRLHAV